MDNKIKRKIEQLQRKGLMLGEIADELNISIADVIKCLGLKNKDKKQKRGKIVTERKEYIRNLFLNEHKSVKKIADELGVSENLVKEDLLTMGINPDISARVNFQNIEVDIDGVHKQKEEKEEDNKAQIEKIIQMPVSKSAITGINERRSVIEDLYYNQGLSEKEISEAIDIAIKTVERDIEFLEKHRKVESVHLSKNEKEKSRARANKRKDEEKKKKIKARREKVAKLYQEGKSRKEIAEELQVSGNIVKGDIQKLLKDGIIKKREFDAEKKQENEAKNSNNNTEEIPENVLEVPDTCEETEEMEDDMSIKLKLLEKERKRKQESRRHEILSFYKDEGKTLLSKIGAENSDTNAVKQRLEQIRSEIIALYEKGYTSEEIEKMTDYNWEIISSVGVFYFETKYTLGRKSRINEKDKQNSRKILRLLKIGKSEEEISKETNIPYEVVCRYVKRFRDDGVLDNTSGKPKTTKKKPNIYTKKTARKIVELQMQGKGFGEIADEMGIDSIIDILKILQHFGMENEYKKGPKEISASRRNQVLSLWKTGEILSEISKKLKADINVIIEDLISVGLSRSGIEEENEKRIKLKKEKLKEEDKKRKEVKDPKEREMSTYKHAMFRSIKLYYKKGDYKSAKAYLEELQEEIPLRDEEKERIGGIIGNLEKLISGKSKQEANIPIGNVEIYNGEER